MAEGLSMPFRVYALEGVSKTQDEAIVRQAVTLAEHDAAIGHNNTKLAVAVTRVDAHAKALDSLTELMNKVIWSLVGLSLTIAGSAVGIAVTVGSGG